MADESLERFAKAVRRVRNHPSEGNAHAAVQAARVAWATLYATLLLAGGVRRDELDALATAIGECIRVLDAIEAGDHIEGYRRQMIWYDQLVTRLREGGLHAVNEAIDDAIEKRSALV